MKRKKNKFSWDKVPLSALDCEILLWLSKEGYSLNQKYIVKFTKSSIGGASKSLNRLLRYGLIAEFKQDQKSYTINPFRKKEIEIFCTGYELGKIKPSVLTGHAFAFEAEINDLPDKLAAKLEKDKSFLSYTPNGWKYAFNKDLPDGSFTFKKTGKIAKLICYFRTFGFSPAMIEQLNHEKFWDLKKELEDEYLGLKIGTVYCISVCPWQEFALLKDPVAQMGVYYGIKHKKIENSLKFDMSEWEEKGPDAREKIEAIIAVRDFCSDYKIRYNELLKIKNIILNEIEKLRQSAQ